MSKVYDMRSYRIAEKRPDPYSEAETRARWARIEAAHEELAKMHAGLDERLQKLSEETEATKRVLRESLRELSKEVKETSRVAQKTSRMAQDTSKIVGNTGRIQGRIAEEFFYAALREEPRIGALTFDKIHLNFEAKYEGRRTEYDLLLTNGEVVAVVEVKHNLRCGNVEDMRKVRVPNARFYLRNFCDRKLLFVMAYITADADAVTLARECGYATLSPDGQKVRADTSCVRYVLPAAEA